jgi:cytochrome c biogenesis protein CcdA
VTIELPLRALAFGAGLVSSLSPCVLSLVLGAVTWVARTDLGTVRTDRCRALRPGAVP